GNMAARTGQPGPSAALSEAQTLPVPVPLRQGQVTGIPSEQMFENLSRKGTYGPMAERVMAGSEAAQREALQGNVEAIQRQVGTGQPIQPGQGGMAAQEQPGRMAAAEKGGVDAAYDQARKTFGALPSAYVQNLNRNIANQIGAAHSLEGLPRTNVILSDYAKLSETEGDAATLVRSLFDCRKRGSNARAAGAEESV